MSIDELLCDNGVGPRSDDDGRRRWSVAPFGGCCSNASIAASQKMWNCFDAAQRTEDWHMQRGEIGRYGGIWKSWLGAEIKNCYCKVEYMMRIITLFQRQYLAKR